MHDARVSDADAYDDDEQQQQHGEVANAQILERPAVRENGVRIARWRHLLEQQRRAIADHETDNAADEVPPEPEHGRHRQPQVEVRQYAHTETDIGADGADAFGHHGQQEDREDRAVEDRADLVDRLDDGRRNCPAEDGEEQHDRAPEEADPARRDEVLVIRDRVLRQPLVVLDRHGRERVDRRTQ